MSTFSYRLLSATAIVLLCGLEIAGAERSQETTDQNGKKAVGVTARAQGFDKSRKTGQKQQKLHTVQKHAKLQDFEAALQKNRAVELGGENVEKFGNGIAGLVKEVGEKIDGALKQSAATALQESKKYEADVLELHEDLEGFGKNAIQLQGDLQDEHKKKVDDIDEVIMKNMAPPASEGSSSLVEMMPSAAANPPMMQQAYGPLPAGLQPTFVASEMAGPPPSSAFALRGEDDDEALLGPENGM